MSLEQNGGHVESSILLHWKRPTRTDYSHTDKCIKTHSFIYPSALHSCIQEQSTYLFSLFGMLNEKDQ